jgi:hypothetical protein
MSATRPQVPETEDRYWIGEGAEIVGHAGRRDLPSMRDTAIVCLLIFAPLPGHTRERPQRCSECWNLSEIPGC